MERTSPSAATEPGARGRWWVAIVAGMASYLDAASITAFGTALVIYQDVLGLTDVQVGVAAGTLAASVAAGAVVGGPLGDRWGRKPVFMTTMILIVAGGGALVVSTGFELVVVGVAVLGLGVGADLPVSLATIAESATSQDRGRLVAFSNLLWLLGIISTFAISAVVGDLGRTAVLVLFGHIVVVAAVVLVARASLPESAVWRAARAARLADGAGGMDDRVPRARVADLVAPAYRAPFLGLMAFLALTSIAASVAGQYGTYVAVTYADLTVATASLISLAAVPLVLVGYLWFMRIADTDRRFTYFRLGAVALVVGPAVLAVLGVSLPTLLVGTLVQAVGGAFAFEGIFKVWAQRSFPTLLRTTAQGLVIGVQRVTSALAVAVVPVTLSAVGPHAFYAILTVTSATGVGVAWAVFRTRDAHDELALDLAGRTVVITGSTGGLGTTLAHALAARGAKLALLDLDRDAVERQAADLGGTDRARGWVCDVRDLATIEAGIAGAKEHFGRVDVVIANAGIAVMAPMSGLSPAEFERIVDINLTGVWRTFRTALPYVIEQRGYLLAISSMAAFIHSPLQGGYTASKAGVWALCDSTRLELRHQGVGVGSVHPTFFDTPMMDEVQEDPAGSRLWGGNSKGLWTMVDRDQVVADVVDGIERRKAMIVCPRRNSIVARTPGLFRPIVDRVGFPGRTIPDAIRLASPH